MLRPSHCRFLVGLLLYLELRFGPGLSLFSILAHRALLDASKLGFPNGRSGQVPRGMKVVVQPCRSG
jgi:hypothetical protein